MKVALFCGGLGMRLREYSEEIPKPLVPLGSVPIMWHVMSYYAHYGHRDFVLCLGYKSDAIKRYFLNRAHETACTSDDAGNDRLLLRTPQGEWRITFADTGLAASIGQRLKAVEALFIHEPYFLANYADGLTDFPLPRIISHAETHRAKGAFLAVRPNVSYHLVRCALDGRVLSLDDFVRANIWINGGYFVFSNEIFKHIEPGDELVEKPFARLIAEHALFAVQYDGFWRCVDTFKDLQALETMMTERKTPWMVWQAQG